jgi:ppGpp synthetase/RelA/SpoT-type nucleotidyltranferase
VIAADALETFEKHSGVLERIRADQTERLRAALQEAGIKTHSLSSRLKTAESLGRKLARPDKTYASLWEVTDLVGLRVTTYFEDIIPDVAHAIENRFNIDFHHTQDRMGYQDYRSFGYRSLHYVCAVQEPELPQTFRFEVQVRTILQHAWAEIEHDLGYKASDSTPDTIRRRFTRIAGLLELADEEFVSIRQDLRDYEESVMAAAGDAPFPLDRLTLQRLVESPPLIDLDSAIAELLGKPLSETTFFPEYLLKMLRLAGFRSTRQVYQELQRSRPAVLDLIHPYFEFSREAWRLSARDLEDVPRGYALFFLSHVAILESTILEQNKLAKLAQFYRELDYPNDEISAHSVAAALIEKLAIDSGR